MLSQIHFWLLLTLMVTVIVFLLVLTWRLGMASAKATLTITINAVALSIPAQTLPTGEVGVAFPKTQLMADGGTPPDNWVVSAGALPPGLVLDPTGVISGVPTTPGTTSFEVTVTDSGA